MSKVLSKAFEPISKSTVHELVRKVSEIKVATEPKERRMMAMGETKLKIRGEEVYVWATVDVDAK